MIINGVSMLLSFTVFLIMLAVVPEFSQERTLLLINSISMVLNVIGVTWFYNAIEQYAYITTCSIVFKIISILMMFLWVKNPEDYIKYGAITVFAGSASYLLNFWNLRKYISFKKTEPYDFMQHMKPIMIFFAPTAAISVYTNLDIVMIRFMKGNAEVGYYTAAIKVKTLLVSLITSLGTVLLPRLSYYIEKGEKEEFHRMVVKAFNFVMLVGLSVTMYFIFMARESILLLAGDQFAASILPMQILMPAVWLIGLSNITGIQILTPLGYESKVVYSIVYGAALDFVLNLVLIGKYGAAGAAFATLMAAGCICSTVCVSAGNAWKTGEENQYQGKRSCSYRFKCSSFSDETDINTWNICNAGICESGDYSSGVFRSVWSGAASAERKVCSGNDGDGDWNFTKKKVRR